MEIAERIRTIARRVVPAMLVGAGLLPASVVFAQSQPVITTLATAADAKQLAATTCAGCHGELGQGNAAAGFPRLAGTGSAYLLAQLDAFAEGYRKNPVMQPIAQALRRQQRIELAQLYASWPAKLTVNSAAPLEPDPSNKGEWLALRGRWTDDIAPCGHCHGPTGLGVGEHFPPLAGQPAAYLEAQLHGWKQGQRPPGPLALMVLIASRLDSADIAAVAKYYAELPVSAKAAGKKGGLQ